MTGDRAPLEASPGSYEGLLTQIMTNTLDQDYQDAADHRAESRPGDQRRRRLAAVGVVAVFGAMISVSAVRTEQQKPAQAAERDELIAQIQLRQRRLDNMHAELSDLEGSVAALQDGVTASRGLLRTTDTRVAALAAAAGAAEALANGLWMAGAEAISINGHRLTTLTAIRSAGRAITVDYRSLTPPYVIDAIGDPETLPARLLETPGGQAWLGLKANFGIQFDTVSVPNLVLPADPATDLHEARPAALP